MAFELPALPYAPDALEPHMSAETFSYHYSKHHQAYVTNLNKAIAGTELEGKSLEEIIRSSDGGVFNNAAQVWNHTFFWHSMKPGGGGAPTGPIADKINAEFGSYEAFKEAFATAGATQFGSGWTWLILENGSLNLSRTTNAETPLTMEGVTPLLTMDVWEHAYYLDYQNARPAYINAFLDNLVNWDFVNANLAAA